MRIPPRLHAGSDAYPAFASHSCADFKYFPFVLSSSFERLLTQSTISTKGRHQGRQPQVVPEKNSWNESLRNRTRATGNAAERRGICAILLRRRPGIDRETETASSRRARRRLVRAGRFEDSSRRRARIPPRKESSSRFTRRGAG